MKFYENSIKYKRSMLWVCVGVIACTCGSASVSSFISLLLGLMLLSINANSETHISM